MFKSINKIGGYIKVSRYTKIHLALKKFQPPWTHKAIQAWMHPFWLKKISSVLCWGTGTGCAKPIFDTQIISNRKYSNPLFPLTMLWFWETETQWWKEQVCGCQYKWESLISGHATACEHRWLGTIHGHKRLSKLRVHKGGLGGMVFSPFYQGLVQSLLNGTKRFLQAFLSWVPHRFVLWVSLHGQMIRACPGAHWLCPGCATITRGPWRHTSSKLTVLMLQERGQRISNQGQGTGKREENLVVWIWHSTGLLWARGGHPSRHCELASCLILFLLIWSLWIYSSKSTSSIMPMIL